MLARLFLFTLSLSFPMAHAGLASEVLFTDLPMRAVQDGGRRYAPRVDKRRFIDWMPGEPRKVPDFTDDPDDENDT